MKLNTRQAAEKLGCATSTISNLIEKGLLTDVSGGDPKKRHNFLIDSKQVNQLRETYKPKKRLTVTNGGPRPSGMLSEIVKRLELLEHKVDSLLQIWS